MRDNLMTTNMRVELLKQDNRDLQHSLTTAKERIEQLEPLEEENYDLQTENNQLRHKLERMDEEISSLKDANDEHQRNNEELTAIASESAAHWTETENAISEAAECIIKMEEEKRLLSEELKQLKERVAALESTSSPSQDTFFEGPSSYPSRVFSVDESRPCTSHFDSDYWSQSDSPKVKQSRESVISFTSSERSKKFLDSTAERKRATRDLAKRMSSASLKVLRNVPTPSPEVPQIPTEVQQPTPESTPTPTPTSTKHDTFSASQENPGRPRKVRHGSLMEAAEIVPMRPSSVVPHASTPQPEGVRGLHRPENPDRPARSKTSHGFRLSSSRPATTTSTNRPAPLKYDPLEESRLRHPNYEYMFSPSYLNPSYRTPSRPRAESDRRTVDNTPQSISSASSGWEIIASSHPTTPSESDLTEIDPSKDKERWWRNIDRMTLSQVIAQTQQATHREQQYPDPARPTEERSMRKVESMKPSNESLRNGERQSRAVPSSAAKQQPPLGKDFLFNAAESEEDFLRKTRTDGSRRRPSNY
jgi:hypothetical protein